MATAIWEGSDGIHADWRTARSRHTLADTRFDRDDALAETLAAAAIDGDAAAIDGAIDSARVCGMGVERLLVGPITAAARRLGDFWIEDECDFVAVTMATWQLRRAAERAIDRDPSSCAQSGRRAVFAPAPGDQHGFGCFVVAEVFVRSGWAVEPVESEELAGLVAAEWIDLIGLTASVDRHLPMLAAAIPALRRGSRNPRLAVIVGGRVFADEPALAETVGADGTSPDAMAALTLADRLVAPLGPPC